MEGMMFECVSLTACPMDPNLYIAKEIINFTFS